MCEMDSELDDVKSNLNKTALEYFLNYIYLKII